MDSGSAPDHEDLWESKGITSAKIAEILHTVSRGDKSKLSKEEYGKKSVWASAARMLFPEAVQQERNRFLLYRFWKFQRKNVVSYYDSLCHKPVQMFPKPQVQKENVQWKQCICEPFYAEEKRENRINCDRCGRWLHPICVNANIKDIGEDDDYICGVCTGDVIVPAIFNDSVNEDSDNLSQQPNQPQDEWNTDDDDAYQCSNNSSLDEDSDTDEVESEDQAQSKNKGNHNSSTDTADETEFCQRSFLDGNAEEDTSENGDDPFFSRRNGTDFQTSTPTSTKQGGIKPKGQPSRGCDSTSGKTDDDDGWETECTDEDPVDTSGMKTTFSFILTPEQFSRCVELKRGKSGKSKEDYLMKTTHRTLLNEEFDLVNKVCALAFVKKKIGDPRKTNALFYVVYAKCKNETCSAKWSFSVYSCPRPGEDVTVHVRLYDGKMKHYSSKPAARKWTGDKKDQIREKLKDKMPASLRLELCADADQEAIRNGKFNTAKSLKSFQRQKEKMEAEQDFDKDIVSDVVQTIGSQLSLFPDKELPGYVREFMVCPAMVTMYTSQQFELLNKLSKTGGPVELMLDATGSLVRPLGGIYGTKEFLLFTIVAKSQDSNEISLPISEMVTTNHTHLSLYSWLYTFFHRYEKFCKVTEKNFGVSKFEIDFSRPLLTSLVRLFCGMPLELYLNSFWEFFTSQQENDHLDVFPIHICRFHVLKNIRKKIIEIYGKRYKKENQGITTVLMDWLFAVVRSEGMHSFDRRVKDIAVLTLFKYKTPYVQKTLDEMHFTTKKDGCPWKEFVMEKVKSGSAFWFRSGFGQYCHAIFSQVEQKNAEMEKENGSRSYAYNIFFSKDLADYFRTYFLPYFPLVSHMVYSACGIKTRNDTTNAIERYFGLLKLNVYKNRRHQKLSRFIRRQAVIVKGLCNSALANQQTRKKGKRDHTSQKRSASNPANSDKTAYDDHFQMNWTFTGSKTKFQGRNYETLSPEKQREIFIKPTKRSQTISIAQDFINLVHVVPWGGKLFGGSVNLTNSCSLDTTLNILLALKIKCHGFSNFVKQQENSGNDALSSFSEVIDFLNSRQFDMAKTVWIRDILGRTANTMSRELDMRSSEFDTAFKFIAQWFPFKRFHRCSNEQCEGSRNPTVYPEVGSRKWLWQNTNVSEMLTWSPKDFEKSVNFAQPYPTACFCGSTRLVEHSFAFSDAPFFFYPLLYDHVRSCDEKNIPSKQTFDGVEYIVFAYTCITGELYPESQEHDECGNRVKPIPHYVVKFIVNDKRVVYDGLSKKPYIEQRAQGHKLTSIWLLPRNL